MSELKDSLKNLIIGNFGSVAAFARESGIPATTIYNVLNRGVEGASFETVSKIYKALNIDWLKTGFDGPLETASSVRGAIKPGYSCYSVPLLGNVAAGEWREVYELNGESVVIPDVFADSHPRAFGVRLTGDSMNRLFEDGEIAICDPDLEVRDGDVAVVGVNGDEATIKRVFFAGNMVVLHAETTIENEYPDRAIDVKDPASPSVHMLGRVFWKTLPAKEIKL